MGPLRPRAERHRRSRRISGRAREGCRSSRASTSSRFSVDSRETTRRISVADLARRLDTVARQPRAARLSGRRERDQSADAHRGDAPGGLRLARTRSSACARRCRWRTSTFCAAFFNSFVVNYLVRLRVTTHVTTAIVERLPIPTRDDAPAACRTHRRARAAPVAAPRSPRLGAAERARRAACIS